MSDTVESSKRKGIAEYLEQFNESPYDAPLNPGLQRVDGVSTLKGSWTIPQKKQ